MIHLAKALLIALLLLSPFACSTTHSHARYDFEQGKRAFDRGYYKQALTKLLPLACDGNRQAQYAVGYMYYYGLGVAQDKSVGYFWIKRAADHGDVDAQKALVLMK